jgi:hypothetical protein
MTASNAERLIYLMQESFGRELPQKIIHDINCTLYEVSRYTQKVNGIERDNWKGQYFRILQELKSANEKIKLLERQAREREIFGGIPDKQYNSDGRGTHDQEGQIHECSRRKVFRLQGAFAQRNCPPGAK